MSTHSSQDFELDDFEFDLKNLSDDLYLDDVGEWREDIENYSSESDEFLTRDQNSRAPQRQNRFGIRGRNISLKRGVSHFSYRGKGRPTGRRNFNDSAYRQFNNEKGMNLREDGRRKKISLRRLDSYSKEDDPDSSTRRNQEYDVKRREGRFITNRHSDNENESLQNTIADDVHKNTLFDRINTFSGSKCNEIPGLEFTGTYSDEKNKGQYGQENQREKLKRQEHSPEPSRSSYSDKISLSPTNSNKRHSLERTGSSASYYNSESRSLRRYRSEYDSRRHKSRSLSPRSPRSDDFKRDHSPQNQPFNVANKRCNGSSPERYFHRTDSPRRSVSVSPERNRIPTSVPSPSVNSSCKKEWYSEESSYLTQPSSSDYQNPQQMPSIPPAYSGSGQYADTSAVTTTYGPNYRNYTDYNNPVYSGYDVSNTSTAAYFHHSHTTPVHLVQPYLPLTNPQEYTRTEVCQQNVRWPVHSDPSATYSGQNQSQSQVVVPVPPVCPPQETFPPNLSIGITSSDCQSGISEKSIEEKKKKEAIENELKQQRKSLAKQREEYYSKSRTLRKELELLQNQKKELLAEKLPENEKILKENQKLQTEIQNKLKAIANVTEMLSTIIGNDKELIEELEDEKKKKNAEEASKLQKKYSVKNSPTCDRDFKSIPTLLLDSKEQNNKHCISESYKLEEHGVQESEQPSAVLGKTNNECVKTHYNYVHYDPEMHWCRVCNVFPKTAKEYLNHLHSAEHKEKTLEKNLVDMPWHKNQRVEETSHYEGAPVKRLPIRGLQFFISATAWYCKLCDIWIGDLHCASVHLKSTLHSQKYSAFTEQNPHWEVNWLADRTRAYEKSSEKRQKQIENSDALNSSSSFRILSEKDSGENAVEITKSLSDHLMSVLKEKNKKQSRSKHRRSKSSDSSSSDSSSSSSTSSDNTSDQKEEKTIDRAHSIRVAMRNKDIPSTKASKVDLYERKKYSSPDKEVFKESRRGSTDDRILHEWMEFSSIDKDRDMINNLKDRLKRKQATDHEVVDRKKQYDKRRSSREEYRRNDERSMKDDYRKYDDRKKGYDDVRKRQSCKYDFDERHGNKRNEKSPDRRSDKSKAEKQSSKNYYKHPDSDEKNVTKMGTSSTTTKQNNKSIQEENDSDTNESSLEKLTAESAAKKKDVKKSVQPFKCKLPFIGRMPFIGKIPAIKKKGEGDNVNKKSKQDIKNKQGPLWQEIPKNDESSSVEIENRAALSIGDCGTSHHKNETESSAKTVNFPLIVDSTTAVMSANKNVLSAVTTTSIATTNAITVSITDSNTTSSNKSNNIKEQVLPRSTLILSKTPGVSGKSTSLKKKKTVDDGIAGGVEDMDIEVEDNDELSEENLPKDFQDALDILFPTETLPVENLSVENQSLINVKGSEPNNPTVINMKVGQNHSNVIQNADRIGNTLISEQGQRNMFPMSHIPGLIHQYGISNVPPMVPVGGSGRNNTNSSGHFKPSLLGPGPQEQMIVKHSIPCDGQIGPELEVTNGRHVNCRPDFSMIPNRMGQCLIGPGPDHVLCHLSHQQPEMMMPQGGPGSSVCPGIMGPGPPAGPVSMGPPGPHPELGPGGIGLHNILPPFDDEQGGIDNDHSHSNFIFKRKNPPSQKKRQQLKKRRDMLEAREKELNEKIAQLQGKLSNQQTIKDGQSDTNNKKDDSKKMELAMLGIDEDDICCK